MISRRPRGRSAIAALAVLLWAFGARADADVPLIIQARVGQLLNGSEVKVAGEAIASTVVLPAFYERTEYRPAWTDPANVDALLAAIADSATDGLTPADYHLSALQALHAAPPSPARDADFDMLATDAVVRLAYHLRFGKIDVARIDPNWNFRSDYEAILHLMPAVAIHQALDETRLREALASLRPNHPLYAALRGALETYRGIEAAGGWKPIASGKTLRAGESDPRIAELRARLAAEGYLELGASDDAEGLFDPALEAAIREFQARHGLASDGALGARTLRALNEPVTARIDQIRLSLERARLIMHDLPERFVIVNVPGFRLYYIEQGETRFRTNVVVGKLMARTPIFRAELTYAVVNPSWTVPPVVMKNDILPGLARDPQYLERKGLTRVGNQIVQPPGPNNALGRIKLMMPNPHFVYLHDTPARALFEKDSRTFSSGCVRVEDVFDLAAILIADPRWSKAKLLEAADSGRTRTIPLTQPLPVLIAYWTAGLDPDGQVVFYEDIYNRDPAELKALDGSFKFHPRAVSAAASAEQAPR